MAKSFITYEEMQSTVDIMATMISNDHKRRLVFYRERAVDRSVRTIRTAIVNLVTDKVTPLGASFAMDGPTNEPLVPMAKWKGFRLALSRYFFTKIARKPELVLLATDRDIASLVGELPELEYLLEFNKYLKRSCFTNISANDMESKDGWPASFTWSSTHRHDHSVRRVLVERKMKWYVPRLGDGVAKVLVEATVTKYGVTVKDNGMIQHLNFALTYPVTDWPTINDLMVDPQVEPLIDLWLNTTPKRAG